MTDPTKDPSLIGQIFNERAALLAFFGALGGAVRSATLRTTWKEGLRVIFVGGVTSFAFGELGPFLLQPWIGKIPDELGGKLGTLCAVAFLTGLIAVTVFERFLAKKEVEDDKG
ncbi:hypothetical protein [Pseudooceanicola sp.]|uniref:hypothetical protein n=1 Tax=Pseudooceanicola sp. TaxID=1914328 RepID=UPI0035C6B95D